MSSQRHERVGRLFLEAIELPASERASFLDRACSGDAALRADVAAMVDAEAAATSFLGDRPALGTGTPALEPRAFVTSGAMPEHIGPYEIESVLGEGGMGVVYKARQRDPDRVVALKVIRAGVSTPTALRRFEHEKQALARLNHPGIAQIYDAGTFDVGTGAQPYFAMEFVEGEPLTTYVERQALDLPARCRLLMQCSAAVEHAHQKGVIHRDLKPANILVGVDDEPRVLDFGVARVTGIDAAGAATAHTGAGQLIGTLPYMSPEQVRGPSDDLDTRSDVYALGVIAYQMFAGRLPYDLESHGIGEAARIIAEDEPIALGRTRAELRGDLSTIVDTALAKDRDRRYQSAAALGDDLERYLHDRPIAARPATTIYRIRKYARRNRLAFVAIVIVLLSLVLGIAGTSIGLVRSTVEARRLAAMNGYFRSMLTSLTPARVQGEDVTVHDMLAAAEANLESALGNEPIVRAEAEATIGAVYRSLGDLPGAERLLLAAEARAARHGGPAHRTTLSARIELSRMYTDQGRFAEAAELAHAVLTEQRDRLGWDDPVTLDAANLAGWATYLAGDLTTAGDIFRDTLARRERVLGVEHEGTLLTMANLALVLVEQGDPAGAEIAAQAVAAHQRVLGPTHPNTLYVMHVEAHGWATVHQFEKAAARHREVVERAVDVLGPNHTYTLFWRGQLSADLRGAGALEEAEHQAQMVVDARRTQVGGGAGNLIDALNELASVRRAQERYVDAEQLSREALRMATELEPPDPARTWWCRYGLADTMAGQGRVDEARTMIQAVLDEATRGSGPPELITVAEQLIRRLDDES